MSADSDLEFGGRVFLQDAFSGVADRIATRFRSLDRTITAGSARVGSALRSLSQRLGSLDGVAGRAREALGGFVERRVARAPLVLGQFARNAMSAAASLARFTGVLALGAVVGVFRLGVAAARSSSEMENLRIAFTTMLGSSEAANEHLRMLQQFAVGKPFEFRDLVVASRNLQTFGFQAAEVQGLLQDFGDAAFNAGTGIRGVMSQVNVFGTILATNKVTFGQLRQLVRAGVPAFQILREQLHLTDEQLRNIARSAVGGRAIIDALRRGMQQRFLGGMERASQTITAALSDLRDVGGIFLSWIGDEMRPAVLGFLNEFRAGLGRINMQSVTRSVGQGFVTLMRLARIAIAPVLGAFSDLGERWERDSRGPLGSLRRFLLRAQEVVEGVVALVASDDSRGMARIPRALHDQLVRRGLWPITVRIAQWSDRVRKLLGGFVEGFVSSVGQVAWFLRSLSNALGLSSGKMLLTRDGARDLGRALGALAVGLLALRGVVLLAQAGMVLYRVAVVAATVASMAFRGATMLVRGAVVAYQFTLNVARIAQQAYYLSQVRVALGLERLIAGFRALAGMAQLRGALMAMQVRTAAVAAGTRLWAAAQWALNAAMAANPIGLILGYVVLLAAGTYLLARHWDQVTAALGRMKYYLASLAAWNPVLALMIGAFTALPVAIAWTANNLGRLKNVALTVSTAVSGVFSAAADSIRNTFNAVLRGIAENLASLLRALPARLQTGSVAEAVARLDAFGREPPPNQGTTVAPPAQPVAPAPTVPQLVVQRTTAQAAAARGAGTAQAPVVNVPTPVVREVRVMLDGREVGRAVGRQAEDDHLRAGGAGSDD